MIATMTADVPKAPEKTERILFACTPDEKAAWQAEAKRQGVSLSELLRHAMAEYLTRQAAKKPRKSR